MCDCVLMTAKRLNMISFVWDITPPGTTLLSSVLVVKTSGRHPCNQSGDHHRKLPEARVSTELCLNADLIIIKRQQSFQ